MILTEIDTIIHLKNSLGVSMIAVSFIIFFVGIVLQMIDIFSYCSQSFIQDITCVAMHQRGLDIAVSLDLLFVHSEHFCRGLEVSIKK